VQLLDQKTKQFTKAIYNTNERVYQITIPKQTSFSVMATAAGYAEASASMYDVDSDRKIELIIPKSKPSILSIRVTDAQTQQIIPNATIIAKGNTRSIVEKSNVKTGQASVSFETAGAYQLSVAYSGYTTAVKDFVIETTVTGKTYIFDAKLDRIVYGLLVSAVDAKSGVQISNVTYKLVTKKTGTATALVSNTAGSATTPLVGAGEYDVICEAVGYDSKTQLLIVENAQNEIVIKLNPIVVTTPKPAPIPIEKPAPPKPVVAAAKSIEPLEKGKTIVLNNIYFDQSSPVLKPESTPQLDELVNILHQNTNIRIEIRGHTDNVGDFDLNVKLSRERAKAVAVYLTQKGINSNRLQSIGRGPLDAIAPNTTEDNRKKNRRVELVVL
jgi:OmpA-OmpF porin, OOP family